MVKLNSIRWQLPLSYAGIALLAALALGVVLLSILRGYYAQRELQYLTTTAATIQEFVDAGELWGAPADKLAVQMQAMAFVARARVRLIAADGSVRVDTGPTGSQMVALSSLPLPDVPFTQPITQTIGLTGPVQAAKSVLIVRGLPGGAAVYRQSEMLPDGKPPAGSDTALFRAFTFSYDGETTASGDRSAQVVRQPLTGADGKLLGYVELSEGPAYGSEILASVGRGWALAGAVAVLLATLAGWLASRRISRPLLALSGTTERMAEGDFTARAPDTGRTASELGRLARSFNHMADQVEGTVCTLRRFVSDAAHEIHTPLTALRTNLELAGEESDAASQAVFLKRALDQVQRLQQLTDELLQLSRIEAGGQPSRPPVDLARLMQQMAEAQAAHAEQMGLELTLAVPAIPVVVAGPEGELASVLDNLVDNAVKFTPEGGTVAVALDVEPGWAVVEVCDDGIGIPAEDLPQLFSRFHRGRNASAYPGSGLGLAMVKAVAESHGGTVNARNGERGACFCVKLPCIGADVAGARQGA